MDTVRENECECSEEYGPCELHGEVLAQRDGRDGADHLALQCIADVMAHDNGSERIVIALLAGEPWQPNDTLSVVGWATYQEANDNLTSGGWCEDPDLSQAVSDLVWMVECNTDLYVTWDDGYTIVRVSDDCPLVQS
jgi:hypothetical protein